MAPLRIVRNTEMRVLEQCGTSGEFEAEYRLIPDILCTLRAQFFAVVNNAHLQGINS